MTENKTEGSQTLKCSSKFVRTKCLGMRPLWTRTSLNRESQYCHKDFNEYCYSEETFDTYNCYICNVEVPVLCFKKHNESEKHITLKTIFQKVLERVSKQINVSVINNDKDINKNVYYCVPCSKIIKIENKHKHESSQYHVKSQRAMNVVHEFNKIFEESKGHVGVKEVELDEKRDLSENNYGAEIIQNDTKNNNVKHVTNEEKSKNYETKTVCSTNDNTMKPTCTVEHLVPDDKLEELSSEENYFIVMIKKYNLKINLPIVDGEFIHVASPSGVRAKIPRYHFHSYLSIVEGIMIYCQMCHKLVELRKESKHKVSEEHARNIFEPVNEQFGRSFIDDDEISHCLLCNKLVLTSTLSEDHLCNDYHSTILSAICQNNEDLANGINTENNIEQAHSENHVNKAEENKIIESINNKRHLYNDKHVKLLNSEKVTDIWQNNEDLANRREDNIERTQSEENNIIECINNKEYICKVNLSENDLGGDHNESGRLTKDAASVQKLVICKLCNVSVPQDQMEYHNAGTVHWSNALKNICTGVLDGLQAYFSKDNLKTDSYSSEKQKDILRNDNVAKQNEVSQKDNVTKQNEVSQKDNVTKQNEVSQKDILTTQNNESQKHNLAKPNEVSQKDNVTKQNDVSQKDNAAKPNEVSQKDNVTTQNDVSHKHNVAKPNEVSQKDNVTKQNDVSHMHNVAKPNEVSENDNVAKQNEVSENDNVTNQYDTLENDNVASSSVSNITINDIDSSGPFKYVDSTKNEVTCIVCDVDFANVPQGIKKHEARINHDVWLRSLLKFHTIRKNPKRSFCECCCDANVSNIWAHIGTEQHTISLQLGFEIESEGLKLYNYKSKVRNNNGIMYRYLYTMLLESNKIYKLPNSNFYCTFCELELSEKGSEIDHMFSEAHEKWLKLISRVKGPL